MKSRPPPASPVDVSPARLHEIIVNERREYAVWPSERRLPAGWRHIGKAGPQADLRAYLRSVCAEPVTPRPVRK